MKSKEKLITGTPKVIPKNQTYFYTQEWQKGEIEAGKDIKKERVSKTKNLKELFKKLEAIPKSL